jgi:beta-alanine degradation protein BauB
VIDPRVEIGDITPRMAKANSVIEVDDDQVRATRWTFREGDETGHHVHEYDYCVVPLTGGTFTVTDDDGTTSELVQLAGVPYRGTAGTSHNVANSGASTAVFVDVELKQG